MIKLKAKVNKSAIMRELNTKAIKGFKDSYEPQLQIQAYMNGVHDLFKLLRLDIVSECPHENTHAGHHPDQP